MKATDNKYIISGGEEGKKRLHILSDVLSRYTKQLLETDGKISGQNFLDLGCGGGDVSLMAAKLIGENGSVTAIDFDKEIISLAQKEAQDKGFQNVSFRVMSAYEMDFENDFDIVYSRFLLSHLRDPFSVIKKMLRALKPGGKLIAEDVQFSGHFCYPECKAFDAYLHYYSTAAKNNEQDPEIGVSLFHLFQQAGIEEIRFDVIQPCFQTGMGKWMAYITLDKIKESLVSQGLAAIQTIDGLLKELEDFTNNDQSIISLPRIFRVWGIKK